MPNVFEIMTDEELKVASAKIAAEIQKRERVEKEKLWKNFVDALRAYCKKCGNIEIHDDDCSIYLNHTHFDLEIFGEITAKYG